MRCVIQESTDPYFNIASEEYLLKGFSDDIFMLYRNEPSIIVGKHQNAFAEVNHWFVKENQLKVVRRLSGGGTVFHDWGNLNFCFISNGQDGNLIDFKKFSRPILEVLHQMGVPAEQSGRNDLIIHGLKFSGNAEHVYKKRTLHHGTLLFSSELANLREALKVNQDLYQDKAVKSVRSKVTNISEYLSTRISLKEFEEKVIGHVMSQSDYAVPYRFTEQDKSRIHDLMDEKYATWGWNYGYSPKFIFTNQGLVGSDLMEISLEIEKGRITHAEVKRNKLHWPEMSQLINGGLYEETEILEKLRVFGGIETIPFIRLLF